VEGVTVGCGAVQPSVGEFFSEIATLEALAVSAFARLAEELSVHGAPEELVASARRSQADEVRHARTMGAMARRYGAHVSPVPEVRLPPRTLLEMALENAVEGCVRETFGGLFATYQADHAEDEMVARVFQAIADEETGHGALAWEVAAWLETKLTEAERRLVREARHRALADLMVELEQDPGEDLARAVGLPNSAVATALCRAMGDGLLRDAA
jgi:rubrerythrin